MIYPVTANDRLVIDLKNSFGYGTEIIISSIEGKIVFRKMIQSERIVEIETKLMPRGVYSVEVRSGVESIRRPVIIQ